MDSKNEEKYDSKSNPLDYSTKNESLAANRASETEKENQPHGRDVSSSLKWWTEEEDKQVRWKLDRVCVPLMFLAYGLSSLDRGNIGNAKVAGMPKDLGFDDAHYQWLLTIFYIFYSTCQFLIFGYKLVKPHVWVSFAMTVWALASLLQASAFNWAGLMVCRAFLGISEASFGTGIVLYLTFHYPKKEVGFRFAIVIAASALASCFSGALAYGITSIKHSSVATWKLLFVIEGIPTLFAAALVFFFLPDSPLTAKFLTPREREIADARRFAAQVDKPSTSTGFLSQVDWKNAAAAFKSPISYLNAVLLFVNNVGYSSIPVYLPKIIKELGYSSINAQGYSAPPYLVAFVFSLCIIFVSDRLQIRGPFIMVMMSIGGVGYLMLALADEYALSVHARYAACYLVALSLFTNISLTYMWLISNQAGDSKRGAGLAIFATVGQCGPFLGTRLFPDADAPYYTKGTAISGGLLFFGVILAAFGSVGFWYSNRKRSEAEARLGSRLDTETAATSTPTQELSQGMGDFDVRGVTDKFELERRAEDVARRGEDSPYFRYTI